MTILIRYWHTLRHLRPIQIYSRVRSLIWKPSVRSDVTEYALRPRGKWNLPARRTVRMTGPDTFIFLNKKGSLSEYGWDSSKQDKLWRYNQHYFDDLNAEGAEERTQWHLDLLNNWILRNALFKGTGWEPYPTSLRLVNWIKWTLRGNELPIFCLQNMVVQARWLEKNIEWHLLGNHLFANAKALIFTGIYFCGEEAERWLDQGLQILKREISEQILSDGGHFERSTMYHALILEDLLDLCNMLECYNAALPKQVMNRQKHLQKSASVMLTWLDSMCHADGEIGFFNDAAFDIAPSCKELRNYALLLDIESSFTHGTSIDLSDSGYVRLESESAVALLDIAPIGPDYLPGHAHADTLSFELSIYDKRLLVNTGVSSYWEPVDRLYQRSTSAHNTVNVSNENSSEIWGNFRVARRARPFSKEVELTADPLVVRCSHDGYKRLREKTIHTRKWELQRRNLTVEDTVNVPSSKAQARFYFHPEVELSVDYDHGVALLPGIGEVNWFVEVGIAWHDVSKWHPEFGKSVQNKCLVVDLVDGKSKVCWAW